MSNSDYKAKALLDLDNKKLEESLSFFKKELFNLRPSKEMSVPLVPVQKAIVKNLAWWVLKK